MREPDYSQAACRSMDPVLFLEPATTYEALAVCQSCSERAACIVANLRERSGVWGCSENGRRRVRAAVRAGEVLTEERVLSLACRTTGRPRKRALL